MVTIADARQAAFNGERILVINRGNDSVTLFRPTDLQLIGTVWIDAGTEPCRVCIDGGNL